jgi:hypothetical protein
MARTTTTGPRAEPSTTMGTRLGQACPGGRRPTSWATPSMAKGGGAQTTAPPAIDCTPRPPTPPCARTTTQRARRCPSPSRRPTRPSETWHCDGGSRQSPQTTLTTTTSQVQCRQPFETRRGGRRSARANPHGWICRSCFQNQEAVMAPASQTLFYPLTRWSTHLQRYRSIQTTTSPDQ